MKVRVDQSGKHGGLAQIDQRAPAGTWTFGPTSTTRSPLITIVWFDSRLPDRGSNSRPARTAMVSAGRGCAAGGCGHAAGSAATPGWT